MGKKGSWFSTIIKVFTPCSKEKQEKDLVNKSKKVKKKGRGNLFGNGETKSFIPFFRQPSSIEKILEEADKNNLFIRPNTTFLGEQETSSSLPQRPSSSSTISLIVTSPPANSPPRYEETSNNRLEPNLKANQFSAIRIQAAYRGYMARKSFRTMKGLLRLQRVVKGQNVKRQTSHAIKQMQLLVRAQTQVHTRRIQSQLHYNNMDKQSETTFSKSSFNQLVSEAGGREEWDNGLINSNEAEGKMQKKVEAVMKRERAMAYGNSNQLWKSNPKSAQLNATKTRPGSYPGGYPMWWNQTQNNLPSSNQTHQPSKSINQTPAQQTQPSNNMSHMTHKIGFSHQDSGSTKSKVSTKSTPPLSRTRRPLFSSSKTPPTPSSTSSKLPKYLRARTLDALMKDDDSLASCPPFSVQPNYMSPTVSTLAKARGIGEPKRRFSLPLSSNIGSLRWNNKGGSSKGSSVNSAATMPAAFGRKPFNLYV